MKESPRSADHRGCRRAEQPAIMKGRAELARSSALAFELSAANHGLQLHLQEANDKVAAMMAENGRLQTAARKHGRP